MADATFRPMRRKVQQLSDEECQQILQAHSHGVLALLGDESYPYAVPMSYVSEPGTLWFHSALEGHKVDAVRAFDKASFCVVDADNVVPCNYTTCFRSVIAFGRVRVEENVDEKMRALRLLGDKYYPSHPMELEAEVAKGADRLLMIRLDIEHLTGKEAIELVRARRGEEA